MIKAAFFDIDGTLVPHGSGKNITPSTLEALKLLKEKGVKLFIATGRPYHTASFVIEQFDWDGVMAMNGQYILYQGEVIHRLTFDPESLKEVIKYLDEKEIACSFAQEKGSFMNRTSEKYNAHPRPHAVFKPSSACLDEPTFQVNAYVDECDDDAIIEHFPGAKTARWSDVFSDIIPANGGKDNGIKVVAEYLGIEVADTVAFGDGGNDISMLKGAGLGIAMGNANDKVKASADYVTDNDVDDGIFKACRHFGWI